MQIVIDIPEELYNDIKEGFYDENCRKMAIAIANGTSLPKDATNGDVIKAMFPTFRTDELSHTVWVGYDQMSFKRDWWEAPYKIESEEV